MRDLDHVSMNFNEASLFLLNVCIGFIVFGISFLQLSSFGLVLKTPKAVIHGAISQFILPPLVAFLFIWIIKMQSGLAIGMLIATACPGGSLSNFFSFIARRNVAFSVSLTILSFLLAIIMTPVNIEFWSSLMGIIVEVEFLNMAKSIALIIGLSLMLGMSVNHYFPDFRSKAQQIIKYLPCLILVSNIAVALGAGYLLNKATHNREQDVRTTTTETGIQNSGLNLILRFNFFGGQGSTALAAGWWGIWYIVSGLVVSQCFACQDRYKTMAV